ncbi:MAG: ethylbenzene dehydrogenase-related protein [Planctomycetota bacterium]
MRKTLIILVLPVLLWVTPAAGDPYLLSVRSDEVPVIDGNGNDPVWGRANPITTRDRIADIEITLRSVYSADEVFVLVEFPDQTENRAHKTLIWDEEAKRYRIGPQREDTFVFKWSMGPYPVDLSVSANKPYQADIWYWKAHRTDPSGYADDKLQRYGITELKHATRVTSKSGRRFYLHRSGDAGEAAYQTVIVDNYTGPRVSKFSSQEPSGSRADVRAKGVWQNGVWTIEFRRKLRTGHGDDVQFDISKNHRFGVSRYEIGGRRSNPRTEQPNHGAGEIGEHLTLVFR